MNRTHEAVNYSAVAEVCNALALQGKKPSVRKIREKIGGSFTTLSEHLAQWRKQSQLAESTDAEISHEFKQAILAEFARVNNKLEEAMKAVIAEKDDELKEAREMLTDYEEQTAALRKAVIDVEQKSHDTILALEKKLAVSEASISDLVGREDQLQQKITILIEQCHQAELKAAIASTNAENYLKRIHDLEQQARA